LEAILAELHSNAAYVQTWLKEIPAGGTPTPGFDVTGWDLASQVAVMTTLKKETIEAAHAYNRMRSANDKLSELADLEYGPTAIITTHLRATTTEPLAEVADRNLGELRTRVRAMLIDRTEDLKGHLDTAIDCVEAELGIEAEKPSAERIYEPVELRRERPLD
jgi:hypothetical protein